MNLDLADCVLSGSALTADFLRDGLTQVLHRLRPSLCLPHGAGAQRVHQQVMVRLASGLGYGRPSRQDPVATRDGAEDGGWLMGAAGGVALRVWSVARHTDLDAPARGSPTRVAQRVLLACAEPAGLLTNGDTLRLLLSDPSCADSYVSIPIAGWRDSPGPPDSFRLVLALAAAVNLHSLPLILQVGRLHQARVAKDLRRQARDAITGFINAMLEAAPRHGSSAGVLWQEGLVLVYRLLFILKARNIGAGRLQLCRHAAVAHRFLTQPGAWPAGPPAPRPRC